MKMMFDPASPFYLKPRWDLEFFKWSWYFYKSATRAKVERAMPVLRDINLLSRHLYTEMATTGDLGTFQLERLGLLMLYQTQKTKEHELAMAKRVAALGLEVSYPSKEELAKMEPHAHLEPMGPFTTNVMVI